MATPRRNFHMATIISGGQQRMFALAGCDGFGCDTDGGPRAPSGNEGVASVEEWIAENSTWRPANSLSRLRTSFGAVAVPKRLLC